MAESTPMEKIKGYPAEVLERCNAARWKAEEKGVYSLNNSEKNSYMLWLSNHINRLNDKGKAIEPVHSYAVDLILCQKRVFTLNKTIYIYDETVGTYRADPEGKEIKNMIRYHLDDQFIKSNTIKQIFDLFFIDPRISITADQINKRPAYWIHFLDGYFDIRSGAFYPHNPDYNEVSLIPHVYEPSRFPAFCKYVTKGKGILRERITEPVFLNEWLDQAIPDPDDQKMLMQYIGYSMTLDTSEQKFLMIVGKGGTGKSTLLKLIETILGKSNISSITLQGLQDRFTPAELFLKQANICADIPLTALNEVDMLKRLTGEDTVTVERKYLDPFTFRSRARLFFSANDIPYIAEKTNAFYRRMLILKMDHAPEAIDPNLYSKLEAEIPHLITRAVDSIYESDGMIERSPNCEAAVLTARKDSDTVEAFISDRCENGEKYRVDRSELYRVYKNYCTIEERQPLTNRNFYKELEKRGYCSRRGSRNYDIVGLKISAIIPMTPTTATAAV